MLLLHILSSFEMRYCTYSYFVLSGMCLCVFEVPHIFWLIFLFWVFCLFSIIKTPQFLYSLVILHVFCCWSQYVGTVVVFLLFLFCHMLSFKRAIDKGIYTIKKYQSHNFIRETIDTKILDPYDEKMHRTTQLRATKSQLLCYLTFVTQCRGISNLTKLLY